MFWGFFFRVGELGFGRKFFIYIFFVGKKARLSWREDMGKCRGMECRVVGNKKVYIKEVRPQDEVDDVGSSEDSSGSGSESESVMDWNGVMKRNVVVSSAGLIDGTRDMMEIQERYKDIGRAVKRLRGKGM